MSYRGVISVVNIFLKYFTPNKISFIDVRENRFDWLEWLKNSEIQTIEWFESDISRYQSLKSDIEKYNLDVQLKTDLIDNDNVTKTYYSYSLSQENGLISENYLKNIWNNISVVSQEQKESISIQEICTDANIKHWIIFDALHGLEIFSQSNSDFENIDLLVFRSLARHSIEHLTLNLRTKNFILLDIFATDHPQIVHIIYLKNYPRLFQNMSDENKILIDNNRSLTENFSELEGKYEEYVQYKDQTLKIYDVMKEQQKEAQRFKNDIEILTKKLNDALDENRRLNSDNEKLQMTIEKKSCITMALDAQNLILDQIKNEYIAKGHQKIESVLNELQKFNVEQAINKNLFNKSTTNIIAQIENYVALNNYFNTGSKLSTYHGWPISPDIALFIIDIINEKKYDAIIEFGSGTSTELFAKIAHLKQRNNEKVPCILSFDHLDEYYQKTLNILKRENLDSFVQLELAPLVPMSLQNEDYKYYDCEKAVQTFLENLPEYPRILVLVDGPPGIICKHARYPALPILASCIVKLFKEITVDIVLDDSLRQEEKEVIDKWKVYLKMQAVSYVERNFHNSEKGYAMLEKIIFKS